MPTHRENVLRNLGLPKDTSFSVSELARVIKVPAEALQEVYNRGIGAWKSNPASVRLLSGEKNYSTSRAGKMSKEQWAMARVYSFVDRGKTFRTTDADIARRYKIK
jgi:hypothetical protein